VSVMLVCERGGLWVSLGIGFGKFGLVSVVWGLGMVSEVV